MLSTRARAFSRSFIAALAVLAIAAGITLTAPAQSASAASITLCTGYAACAKYGMSNHGYSTRGASSYWRMYGGHNCTNYAAYMMVAAGMKNVRPWTNATGDARGWGVGYAKATNQTPAVGSIAWWTTGSGHVAYVEAVLSPTEILISEDSWGGDFHWRYISKDTGGWPVGFIHFKDATGVGGVPENRAIVSTVTVWTDRTKARLAAPLYMNPGSTAWVEMKYLNTGRATWSGLTLATQTPADRASVLGAAWANPARAATQSEAAVKPGERATFAFPITIPAGLKDGTQIAEIFSPALADGTRVVAGDGALRLTVDSRSQFLTQPVPQISGKVIEGRTLAVAAGAWQPTTAQLSYAWQRNGVAIAGATTPTYTVAAADVGRSISVKVTARADRFITAVKSSAITPPAASKWDAFLGSGETLTIGGDQVVSPNGAYKAYVNSAGTLVLVNNLTGKVNWSSKSSGKGGSAIFAGSLALRNAANKTVWTTGTGGKGATKVVLSNTGRFSVVTATGTTLWFVR